VYNIRGRIEQGKRLLVVFVVVVKRGHIRLEGPSEGLFVADFERIHGLRRRFRVGRVDTGVESAGLVAATVFRVGEDLWRRRPREAGYSSDGIPMRIQRRLSLPRGIDEASSGAAVTLAIAGRGYAGNIERRRVGAKHIHAQWNARNEGLGIECHDPKSLIAVLFIVGVAQAGGDFKLAAGLPIDLTENAVGVLSGGGEFFVRGGGGV